MAKEILIPNVAESITEVMIAEWNVQDGDYVELDQPICVIETDKASMDLTAEVAGQIKITVEEGEVVQVGAPIGELDESAAPATSAAPAEAPAPEASAPASAPAASNTNYATGHPSPAAAGILAQKGVAAGDVNGTGKDGRITKEDAQNASATPAPAPKAAAPAKAPAADLPGLPQAPVTSEEPTRQKMSMMRRKLAQRLVQVKNQTAMLTTFNEVDMTAVKDIRSKYKEAFKGKHDVNLGFMSFFTKACAIALKEFPMVNAMIDGDEIIINPSANIGIAVSTPKGLVVPVVRKAEDLSFADIEKSILHYALKARAGKIALNDMDGGTFTITNGGIFGSMLSTPILNPPQSGILGMHNIVDRPVAVDGKVEIRPIMYLALSYDHRIIDGKDSVSFLKMVKDILEDPYRYFLGV